MATTTDEMKEAIRADSLGVMPPGEYDTELREFIAATGVSMAEMAGIGLEVLREP
jgi:hypothetical protein